MTLLRLGECAGGVIAAGHSSAADTIDSSASTAPEGVDAGIGTGQIVEILAAVSGTAGDLAALNHGLAAVVRHVSGDVEATDASAAAGLAAVGEALR